MRCQRCGTSVTDFNAYLSHVCEPKPKAAALPGAKEWVDELGWQASLAEDRDHGPGKEQENRFHDGAGERVVKKGLCGEFEEMVVDRTGAALENESKAGGTPSFNAEDEVPKDRHDRAEFRAREWRFPREQIAKAGLRPMDKGLVTYRLTPEELVQYKLTGVMPQVDESRKIPTRLGEPEEPSV